LALVGCTTTDDHPTGTIEQKYAASGRQAVMVALSSQCCDHRGTRYDLYYPTDLAAGSPHPVVTWGNGTGGGLKRRRVLSASLGVMGVRGYRDEGSIHWRRHDDFGRGEFHAEREQRPQQRLFP